MKHDFARELYGIRLRPVSTADVDVILELRGDVELSRFMGDIGAGRQAQLEWLDRYATREGDYYFVIETAGTATAVGLAGIYDVTTEVGGRREGEWGRWVIRPGVFAAPASALLSFRIAFDDLKLDRLHYWTPLENKTVVAFHGRSGAQRLADRDMPVRGVNSPCAFFEITPEIRRRVESTLERFAAQAERMLVVT